MKQHPFVYLYKAYLSRPKETAIIYRSEDDTECTLTYFDLFQLSYSLSRYLIDKKVKKGDVVAVYLNDGPDYVIALWGIWLTGAIYMPLSPKSAVDDNFNRLIEIAEAKFILSIPEKLEHPNSINYSKYEVSKKEELPKELSIEYDIKDRAYIYCSSGYTGLPKVIACPFEGLEERTLDAIRILDIRPSDIILGNSDFDFDASMLDVLMAIRTPCSLYIVPAPFRDAPVFLNDLFSGDYKPTVAALVPSVISALNPSKIDLSGFRCITMGEKCDPSTIKGLARAGVSFFNGYGPTEAMIATTIDPISADMSEFPINTALKGVKLYIKPEEPAEPGEPAEPIYLDYEELKKSKAAEKGELCIGGLGIGTYLGDPALVAEKFKEINHVRLYLSGDEVEFDGENLFWRGRNDRQYKRHGQLIDLDKIEKCLEASEQFHKVYLIYQYKILTGIFIPKDYIAEYLDKLETSFEVNSFVDILLDQVVYLANFEKIVLQEINRLSEKDKPNLIYKIDSHVPKETNKRGKEVYTIKLAHKNGERLRPQGIPFSREEIEAGIPELTADIIKRWSRLPNIMELEKKK